MGADAVFYWLKGESRQNFGDYLSELLLEELFFPLGPRARGIHLIGSVIDELYVPPLEPGVSGEGELAPDEHILFWGCGVRRPGGLTPAQWRRARVLSVRGPLSASELRLGAAVPQGDPGLLLPALHTPRPMPHYAGQSVCIPHFNDERSDSELIALGGCDLLLRTNLVPGPHDVRRFIDIVAASAFVLTASLHGAVVAAAYGIPFGFWDNGRIDLPLKWADFAASLGVQASFHATRAQAQAHYAAHTGPLLSLPSLLPAVAAAPLLPRPDALLRIVRHELAALPPEQMLAALDSAIAEFTQRRSDTETIVTGVQEDRRAALAAAGAAREAAALANQVAAAARSEAAAARLDAAALTARLATAQAGHAELAAAMAQLRAAHEAAQAALSAATAHAVSMRHSTSWRLTAPLRTIARLAGPRLLGSMADLALPGGAARRGRLREVAGAGKLSAKSAARISLYAAGRVAARLPGGAAASGLGRRLLPGPFNWLHTRYSAYRHAAAWEPGRPGSNPAGGAIFWGTPFVVAPAAGPARAPVLPAPTRPRALIIDSRLPQPDRDSGSLDAMLQVRDLLGFGYEVIYAGEADYAEASRYRAALEAEGVICLSPVLAPGVAAFLQSDGASLDVCFLSRVYCGGRYLEAVRRHAPRAQLVFNTVDLHHVREEREATLQGDSAGLRKAAQTRERELYVARQADATIVVSASDRAAVETAVPGAFVVEMPLARPIRAAGDIAPFAARRGVGFVGGFEHPPNVDAVSYLLAEIWPLVLQRLPLARLYIAGSGLPEAVAARLPPSALYQGHVADLDGWLDGLRLTVAPLRYGAGAKGKVASSLAAGVPCVGTPIAAEGMRLQDGVHIAVGDTPAAFAAHICALHEDPARWEVLSAGGHCKARDALSVAAGTTRLGGLLQALNLPVPAGLPAHTA